MYFSLDHLVWGSEDFFSFMYHFRPYNHKIFQDNNKLFCVWGFLENKCDYSAFIIKYDRVLIIITMLNILRTSHCFICFQPVGQSLSVRTLHFAVYLQSITCICKIQLGWMVNTLLRRTHFNQISVRKVLLLHIVDGV